MYANKQKKLGSYRTRTKISTVHLGIAFLVILAVGALCLTSFSPVAATDIDNLPGQLLTPEERGIIPEVDRSYPVDIAMIMGADYLKHAQADITEDNAGNGNPDIDPEDGGWDWVLTAPAFTHSAAASPTNIYGNTALGLYYAYLDTGDATYMTAMADAANYMITDPMCRSSGDLIFLMLYDDLVPGTTYQDDAKLKYDGRVATYGSATALAQYIRDARYGQGYGNGIIAWDIGAYVKVAVMLHARYPGNNYDSDATNMAEVLWQDSFNDNPGYFDIIDDQGYDPLYGDLNYYWYTLGITGLIDAFSYSGAHTSEIPGLLTILLDCQCPSGAFSYQYGGNAGDEDWQSAAYAVMSLGDYDWVTYQTEINAACVWIAGTQDIPSGGWVYTGSGNHYPEVGGECTSALYYYIDTGAPTIVFVPPTPDDGDYVTDCIDISVDTSDPESSPLTAYLNWNYTLMAHWPFYEGVGTTVEDVSDDGIYNDGTINGAIWVPGKFGYGLYFNGTNYVVVPDDTSLQPGANDWTVEAWIKTMSDARGGIVRKNAVGSWQPVYDLELTSTGRIRWLFDDGTNSGDITSSIIVNDGDWHHLVGIKRGDTVELYIDGSLDNSGSANGCGAIYPADELYIGCMADGHSPPYLGFVGSIDEVKVWNRALSLAEIQASYDNTLYPLDVTICGLEHCHTYHYYAIVQDGAGNAMSTIHRTVGSDQMGPDVVTVEIGSPTYIDGPDLYASCATPIYFNVTDTKSGVFGIQPEVEVYDWMSTAYVSEFLGWVYDNGVGDLDPAVGVISYAYYFFQQCDHRFRLLQAEDYLGNIGGLTLWQQCYVDCVAGYTFKTIGDPNYQGGYWVTTSTPINFTTMDPIGSTCQVPITEIHYRISGGPWQVVYSDTATVYFPTEGIQTIEWYCVDALGHEEPINGPQEHYVDDSAPSVWVNTGDPNITVSGTEYYVTSNTPIEIVVTDEQTPYLDPTRGVTLYYDFLYDGLMYYYTAYDDVTFSFSDFPWSDDCDHILYVEAVDDLGNSVTLAPILYHVDDTGPVVSKDIGDPQYQGGYYVSGDTPFTFTANDYAGPCVSGVQYIYFEVDGVLYQVTGDTIIITPDDLGLGEGEYTLEFWGVDNLGNEGGHTTQSHVIDRGGPTSYKTFEGPVCGNVPAAPGWQLLKTYELMGTYPETWYNDVIDLSSYAGQNITLAWRYYSDDEYLGAIDDVVILEDGSPIYSEDFDSYTDDGYYTPGPFPPGWTYEAYGTSCSSPTYYRNWGAESYKRHSLPNSMACYYNCPNDDWVITPEFTLSAGSTYALDYWYFHDDSWDIYLDLYIQVEFVVPEVEGPVWVTSDTEICFHSIDTQTGVESLYIEVWWDSDNNGTVDTMTDQRYIVDGNPNDADPDYGEIEYCLTLPEECTHEIYYYATDYFGHVEDTHFEIDHVDNSPPIVNKTFDGPGTLDYLFLNNQTMITLTATDLPEPYGNGTGGGGGGGGGGDYIYDNDFETDDGGWTVDTSVGDWEWTNTYDVSNYVGDNDPPTAAHSGTGLWGTIIYDDYTNSGSETTMSQTFDFTGYSNVYLSFASWSDLFGSWDYGQVLVNGVEVFYVDDYPGTAWTEENISLAAYDGMSGVEIVFSVHASTVVNYAGWYIDDVRIGGDSSFRGTIEWLYHDTEGIPIIGSSDSGATMMYPGCYIYTPDHPTRDANILVYTDDWIHTTPNTFVQQALSELGLVAVVHVDGDYTGFISDLNSGTWDLVIWSGENYVSDTTASALIPYVQSGGKLIATYWRQLYIPTDPLWSEMGFTYINNYVAPPSAYWWNPSHPIFTTPESAPEWLIRVQNSGTSGGTYLEPTSSGTALAGYTTSPAANQAGIIIRNDGNTIYKGLRDVSTDIDSDTDGLMDGTELWINMINYMLTGGGPSGGEGCASGVVKIEYRIWTMDGGWGNWTDYTGPFNFTEGCTHYLQYRAVDCLGNTLLCEDDLIEMSRETDTLLEEGFEGTLFPPSGWDQTIYNSYATFERYSGLAKDRGDSRAGVDGLPDAKEPQGSYCACVWWDYYEQDEWLFMTTPVDLSGYSEASLKFYTYNYDSISWVEHDYVKISTNGGSTWTTLGDMAWDYPNHFWGAEIVYDLDSYLGESVVIGFHRVTPDGGSGAWGIDHVRIEAGTGGNGGDEEPEQLPITVYNQTHYVDLEPPVSWIELELDHDGNMITPYTEFMIWQEDFACNQTGGSQCCTIHFRIDGPPGSMFYWNGQYYAADGGWHKGGTGFDEPVAFQIRDNTGYIKAGKYVVEYWAEDCLGNVEPVIHHHTYYPDTTAPTTTLLFSGPLYHDGYDWINEDTLVNLAADDHQGSGVLAIKYRIDDGAERTYTGPFTLSGDGLHTITYYAEDMVNHMEPARTKVVMVDGGGPDASVSFTGDTYTTSSATWVTKDTTLGVVGGDEGVGLDALFYRVDGGSWQTYQGSFTLGEGSHSVECYGVDKLGNSGPVGLVAVGMDTSAPSVTYQSPQSSHLYIAGRAIMVLPSSMDVDAVIIGPTSVSASAVDGGVGVERVELYVDGEIRYTSHGDSLEFVWNQRTFLRHTLEIVTVDFFGYSSSKTLDLWVFNI